MENMIDIIKKYIENNDRYIKAEILKKELKIKGEEQTKLFYCALNKLVEEGCLFFDQKKGYRLLTNELGYAYGEIEINKNGTGFVHTNDGYTILIENCDLNGALNGDKVIVSSINKKRKDYFSGEIYNVLKRKSGNVIFEVVGNGYEASLIPYNKYECVPIIINNNQLKNLVDGEIVLVKVGTERFENEYKAEISKVIGHKNDPTADLELIYAKYDIPVSFSKEALEEAEKLPVEVTESDIKGRVDLRDKETITIDCDDTKDRDDALYAEKLENGNIKLYVNISAVSYYIKKGSKLFEEALLRCFSHYPINTCNPLFPHKITNGICSINPGVDRLTKTCEIEISPEGKIVNYNIYNSAIRSRKAMKYSEVNRVLSGDKIEDYEPYIDQLNLLRELNDIFEKNRISRNCIDFGINDLALVQDENGNPKSFVERGNGVSERIIENCMLMAGQVVAEHYSWLPFIYRVLESPSELALREVIDLLRKSGFKIPKYNNIDEKAINNILDSIKNKEEANLIRTILLKSMKRAKYDTKNIGHFALQLLKYCQFTSPIRRIDFVIHWLIDEIDNFDYSIESMKVLEEYLNDICKRANDVEKKAQLIEEEALAMEMARLMESHIGESFEGMITDIYHNCMFVRTKNNIIGKVKFENIYDDKYSYDYDKKTAIGNKTNKKYQIGNKVCVIVKDASKETRTINFEIGNPKVLKKSK